MIPKEAFRFAPSLVALLAIVFVLASSRPVFAQAVAPAGSSPVSANGDAADDEEEIVLMTPFEVVAQNKDDARYETSRTNAITGTVLPLERIPMSADIFNAAFLEDMGVVDINDMLTKYAGFGPPMSSTGAGGRGAEPGDATDFKNLSVRGLGASNQRRDGFLLSQGTTWDSFDVEAVEVINGSQSLIYGAGDAGGVLNFVGKKAAFNRRFIRGKIKFDSNGSVRYEAGANYGTRHFAVTAIGITEGKKNWKVGLPQDNEGWFAAVAVRAANWLVLRGEYRKYERTEINAVSASIRAPDYALPSYARDIPPAGMGARNARIRNLLLREGDGFLGFDWNNADSPVSGMYSRNMNHEYYGVVAEMRVSRNFQLQLRWGNDERDNHGLLGGTENDIYHPDYMGNAIAQSPRRPEWSHREWSYRFAPQTGETASHTISKQSGFRLMGNLSFRTGGLAHHQFNFSGQMLKTKDRRISEQFYEVGPDGEFLTLAETSANYRRDAGRRIWSYTDDPLWLPIYATGPSGMRWPYTQFTTPSGRTYRLAPVKIPGWEESTPENPLGLNNGTFSSTAPGDRRVSGTYRIINTDENSIAGSLTSSWWRSRVTSMLGYRFENFNVERLNDGAKNGPLNKNTFTAGILCDIYKNISGYVSYSTNTKVRVELETIDLHGNPIPFEKGVSTEAGFKFSMFNKRITSGNIYVYDTRVNNAAFDLSAQRDSLDPNGLNGYGVSFVPYTIYDKRSQGFGVSFWVKPVRGWDIQITYKHSDGRNVGGDIRLPKFYNDEFRTRIEGGETFVMTGSNTRLFVHSDPRDTNSDMVPLTLGMMKDAESPYYYARESAVPNGRIANATLKDALQAGEAGTGRAGLPLAQNQFGYVPSPDDATVLVTRTGEKTQYNTVDTITMNHIINIRQGWFKGLELGVQMQYGMGVRDYYYGTAADRRLFMEPNKFNMDLSARYEFNLGKRMVWVIQLNVFNLLDQWKTLKVPNDNSQYGAIGEIIVGRPIYGPRLFMLTNVVKF